MRIEESSPSTSTSGPARRDSRASHARLRTLPHRHDGSLRESRASATDPSVALGATHRFNLLIARSTESSRKSSDRKLVQNHIYRSLKTFVRQGFNNKLILLHGPNGSAKTSIIHAIMAGLEEYSHDPRRRDVPVQLDLPRRALHQRRNRNQQLRRYSATRENTLKATPSFRTRTSPRAFPVICTTIRF